MDGSVSGAQVWLNKLDAQDQVKWRSQPPHKRGRWPLNKLLLCCITSFVLKALIFHFPHVRMLGYFYSS